MKLGWAALACSVPLLAQYVSSDTYTRYELLAPSTHQFRILYEVTETRPLAKFHFNIIRPGSEASNESVIDVATGAPLKFEIVKGAAAGPEFNPTADYLKIHLAHEVPARGEYRIRIDKTYKDEKSYYEDKDGTIVFKRSLGIPRNSVVLPASYELLSCSVAAQLLSEPDGRLRIAFQNPGSGGPLEVTMRAKPSPGFRGSAATPRFQERAYQDREILYELLDPSTHAFRITHDYTERRAGTQHYFNIVRTGAKVSDPKSIDLDSGAELRTQTISGLEARKLGLKDPATDDAEVVVTHFEPVKAGGSVRLRLMETYTDAKAYRIEGEEIVWDRTFGRPRNMVTLPPGYALTALESPSTVETLRDGRVVVYTVNPRNDEVRVHFRAVKRRRSEPAK
jgi:hypothetical protein